MVAEAMRAKAAALSPARATQVRPSVTPAPLQTPQPRPAQALQVRAEAAVALLRMLSRAAVASRSAQASGRVLRCGSSWRWACFVCGAAVFQRLASGQF